MSKIFANRKYPQHLLVVTAVIIAGGMLALNGAEVRAAFNQQINYQGKLTNPFNVPVVDGLYNVRFKLYTALSGGSPIWTETWCDTATCDGLGGGTDDRIRLTNGLFSTMLGSTTPFSGIDFNQPLYLSIEIGGSGAAAVWDGEMFPRKILGAVPAAMVANTLQNLTPAQFIRSDVQNATSTSSTFLNVLQTGAGKIAEFFGAASQSVFSILSGGNVGVGTSSPAAKLAISANSGDANTNLFLISSTTAANATTTLFSISNTGSTTAANGFNIEAGCFSVNGSCLNPGSGLNGSGSPNTLTYWTGIGSVGATSSPTVGYITATSTLSTSTIMGALSLGTTSEATLSVNPAMAIYGTTNASIRPYFVIRETAADIEVVLGADTTRGSHGFAGTVSNNPFELRTNNLARLSLAATGNIGIGTTSPAAKLSISALSSDTNAHLFLVSSTTAANATSTLFSISNTGYVGIGTASSTAPLTIGVPESEQAMNPVLTPSLRIFGTTASLLRPYMILRETAADIEFVSGVDTTADGNIPTGFTGTISNHRFDLRTGNRARMTLDTTGNIGIGTTSPYARLSIAATSGDSNAYLFLISSTTAANATTTLFSISNTGSTTASNGFNITSGCFSVNGTCLSSGTSLSGGSPNTLTYWTGAGTVGATSSPTVGYITATSSTMSTFLGSVSIGSSTPNSLSFFSVGTSTPSLTVNSQTGWVGIGTTTPKGVLHLSRVANGASSYTSAFFDNYSAVSEHDSEISFRKSHSATMANGATVDGEQLGALGFLGNTGSAFAQGSYIVGYQQGAAGASFIPTKIVFKMSDGVNQAVDRVAIDKSGNLGVGTTSPMAKLAISAFATDTNTDLFLISSSTAANATTTLFTITNTGAVGIGTSSPPAMLTVDGNIYATGFYGYGSSTPTAPLTVDTGSGAIGLLMRTTRGGANAPFIVFDDASTPNSGTFRAAMRQSGNNFHIGNLPYHTSFIPYLSFASGGNISVGTSSASSTLTIQTNNTTEPAITLFRSDVISTWNLKQGSSVAGLSSSDAFNIYALNAAADFGVRTAASGTANFVMSSTGNFGVGTTSPFARLAVSANPGDTGTNLFLISSTTAAGATSTLFTISNAGRVGISSSTPAGILGTNGSVFMSGLTASAAVQSGYVCLSASNEVIFDSSTCLASSERFKQRAELLDGGLETAMQLRPVSFEYKPTGNTVFDSRGQQVGLIAEEVAAVDPRLVEYDKDGRPRAVRYENLTAVLLKAVQEQQQRIAALANASATTSSSASSSAPIGSTSDSGAGRTIEGVALSASSTTVVASTTAGILAASDSFIKSVAGAVKEILKSAGDWVIDRLTARVIYTDRLEAKVAAVSQGLEMTDQATGRVYCVGIKNGDWSKILGSCSASASSPATSTPADPANMTGQIINLPPSNSSSTPALNNGTTTANTGAASSTPASATTTSPAASDGGGSSGSSSISTSTSSPASSSGATAPAPATSTPAGNGNSSSTAPATGNSSSGSSGSASSSGSSESSGSPSAPAAPTGGSTSSSGGTGSGTGSGSASDASGAADSAGSTSNGSTAGGQTAASTGTSKSGSADSGTSDTAGASSSSGGSASTAASGSASSGTSASGTSASSASTGSAGSTASSGSSGSTASAATAGGTTSGTSGAAPAGGSSGSGTASTGSGSTSGGSVSSGSAAASGSGSATASGSTP